MIKSYKKEGAQLIELESYIGADWININPPFQQNELIKFAADLDIPLDFLTDSLDIDERSRYELEEEIKLILLNTPVLAEAEGENEPIYITVPVGIVLTPEHIITITSMESPVLKRFFDGRVKYFDPSNHTLFVLQILEQTVYRFLTCLKKLNLKRNLIEKELYDSSRNRELKRLLSIEKSLVYFVNSLSSNELLKLKMKRTDFLKIRADEYQSDLFEDIIVDNGQALEMSNVYTNILNGTMDAYGSIISNNLNRTIQRLTTITIILMVPTLIASYYGMNVPLPYQEANFSFVYLMIISVILSALLAWYFQRKRMF